MINRRSFILGAARTAVGACLVPSLIIPARKLIVPAGEPLPLLDHSGLEMYIETVCMDEPELSFSPKAASYFIDIKNHPFSQVQFHMGNTYINDGTVIGSREYALSMNGMFSPEVYNIFNQNYLNGDPIYTSIKLGSNDYFTGKFMVSEIALSSHA